MVLNWPYYFSSLSNFRLRGPVRRSGHNLWEHGRTAKPPSRGTPVRRGFLRFLSLQLQGLPRHLVRVFAAPVLPRLRHLRHPRLHIRRRRCRRPELQHLRQKAVERPEKHHHSPSENWSERKHRHHRAQLSGRGGRGFELRRDLSGEAVAEVLANGVHEERFGRFYTPRRLVSMERKLCVGYALLWGVYEQWEWRWYFKEGQLGGVSRNNEPSGGRKVYRR